MPLSNITYIKNASGLGTPLATKDHISGIVFYNSLPAGFGTDKVKKIFSLEEAEALGIEETGTHDVEHYHIKQYFEKQPKGVLYVCFYDIPTTPESHTFTELVEVGRVALGEIRQLAVYYPHATFNTAFLTAIQTQVATLQAEDKPLNVVFTADIFGMDLTTLPDLTTLSAYNVSVTLGQDGGAKGVQLYVSKFYSISDIGAVLGLISKAKVHENIGNPERFPLVTDGFEYETPAFANGEEVKLKAPSFLDDLDDKGYIFQRKYVGYSGTYLNFSYTAVSTTNDLHTIENNRTIDKSVRNTRLSLIPKINSSLYLNDSGGLTDDTIATFKSACQKPLSDMQALGELSGFDVVIDANQNVLTTKTVNITLKLLPVGVAKYIVVKIGFVLNL